MSRHASRSHVQNGTRGNAFRPAVHSSEFVAGQIDHEVQELLADALRRATEVLETHADGCRRIVDRLKDEEELPGETITELLEIAQPA